MLTIKQITENTDAVLRGLEKKHFKNAKETIAQVLDFNDKRKANQTILDKNLAEANSLSKSIGQLMKEGKKEEAEAAKKPRGRAERSQQGLASQYGPGCQRFADFALYHPQRSLRQRA